MYQKGCSTKPPQLKYSHAGEAQLRKPLHPFLEILEAVDWESGHLILQPPIFRENPGYSLIDYGQFTANLKQIMTEFWPSQTHKHVMNDCDVAGPIVLLQNL